MLTFCRKRIPGDGKRPRDQLSPSYEPTDDEATSRKAKKLSHLPAKTAFQPPAKATFSRANADRSRENAAANSPSSSAPEMKLTATTATPNHIIVLSDSEDDHTPKGRRNRKPSPPIITYEIAQQSIFGKYVKKGQPVTDKLANMARMGMAKYSKQSKIACSGCKEALELSDGSLVPAS